MKLRAHREVFGEPAKVQTAPVSGPEARAFAEAMDAAPDAT
jgi:hypothetical protein